MSPLCPIWVLYTISSSCMRISAAIPYLYKYIHGRIAWPTTRAFAFPSIRVPWSFNSFEILSLFEHHKTMGFHLSSIVRAKQFLQRSPYLSGHASSAVISVPKGCLAVYVGESQKKRFVIPVSYLKQPSFQHLLSQAEEEFGYDHPMGGLTIHCKEDIFMDVISCINGS